MDEDVKRLLTIIKRAPSPFGKTDSELAQEYRNWYLGSRLNMKAAEQSILRNRFLSNTPDAILGGVFL